MKRAALTLLAPTVAVCRFGCASCYAAPITVLWLAGIVAIIFGFLGVPVRLTGTSWSTVVLGLALWGIASLWTAIAIRGSSGSQCGRLDSQVRHTINSGKDGPDPVNKIRRAR